MNLMEMVMLGVLCWRQCCVVLCNTTCIVLCCVDSVVLETVCKRKDKRLPKFMSLGIVADHHCRPLTNTTFNCQMMMMMMTKMMMMMMMTKIMMRRMMMTINLTFTPTDGFQGYGF